jgi:predicted Fe-Mo cluster-binding NifX family protein
MYRRRITMKKLVYILALGLFVIVSTAVFAADKTKIAVASDGSSTASAVSPVAARSSYFLIFDEKGTFYEAVANPHKNAGGGAGTLVVDYLAGKNVTTIVAGEFGDKMVAAMSAKSINYIKFKGTAADAVKTVLKK